MHVIDTSASCVGAITADALGKQNGIKISAIAWADDTCADHSAGRIAVGFADGGIVVAQLRLLKHKASSTYTVALDTNDASVPLEVCRPNRRRISRMLWSPRAEHLCIVQSSTVAIFDGARIHYVGDPLSKYTAQKFHIGTSSSFYGSQTIVGVDWFSTAFIVAAYDGSVFAILDRAKGALAPLSGFISAPCDNNIGFAPVLGLAKSPNSAVVISVQSHNSHGIYMTKKNSTRVVPVLVCGIFRGYNLPRALAALPDDDDAAIADVLQRAGDLYAAGGVVQPFDAAYWISGRAFLAQNELRKKAHVKDFVSIMRRQCEEAAHPSVAAAIVALVDFGDDVATERLAEWHQYRRKYILRTRSHNYSIYVRAVIEKLLECKPTDEKLRRVISRFASYVAAEGCARGSTDGDEKLIRDVRTFLGDSYSGIDEDKISAKEVAPATYEEFASRTASYDQIRCPITLSLFNQDDLSPVHICQLCYTNFTLDAYRLLSQYLPSRPQFPVCPFCEVHCRRASTIELSMAFDAGNPPGICEPVDAHIDYSVVIDEYSSIRDKMKASASAGDTKEGASRVVTVDL